MKIRRVVVFAVSVLRKILNLDDVCSSFFPLSVQSAFYSILFIISFYLHRFTLVKTLTVKFTNQAKKIKQSTKKNHNKISNYKHAKCSVKRYVAEF